MARAKLRPRREPAIAQDQREDHQRKDERRGIANRDRPGFGGNAVSQPERDARAEDDIHGQGQPVRPPRAEASDRLRDESERR